LMKVLLQFGSFFDGLKVKGKRTRFVFLKAILSFMKSAHYLYAHLFFDYKSLKLWYTGDYYV